jgi:hypothetical protein
MQNNRRVRSPAAMAVQRIDTLTDPSQAELQKLEYQSTATNFNNLRNWSKHMRYHESQTVHAHERVYLVVSDLKLILASRQKVQKAFEGNFSSGTHSVPFLDQKEIESLHEKHWAVEINGRYYELVRDENSLSFFSSRSGAGQFDRRVAARIFIGTTHCEHRALDEIGTCFSLYVCQIISSDRNSRQSCNSYTKSI